MTGSEWEREMWGGNGKGPRGGIRSRDTRRATAPLKILTKVCYRLYQDPKESYQLVENRHPMTPLKIKINYI